jgi:hypothetical protein
VDGTLGAWTYILSFLYPLLTPALHKQPEIIMSGVYTLLPVVHKYDFPKLLSRLMAFVERNSESLSHYPAEPSYIVRWLALAERLQLDELLEVCLGRLWAMTRQQLQIAITVESGESTDKRKKYALRNEVKQLGQAVRDELLTILAVAP